MSRFTTTKRFSKVGSPTFRRLYVSDDSDRSIYIVKRDNQFYLNYNYKGTITKFCEDSSQKLIGIVKEFERKYMVDASKTASKAIQIYSAMVTKALKTQSTSVDVIAHKFRICTPNYMNISLEDIERALNTGRNYINH